MSEISLKGILDEFEELMIKKEIIFIYSPDKKIGGRNSSGDIKQFISDKIKEVLHSIELIEKESNIEHSDYFKIRGYNDAVYDLYKKIKQILEGK